MQGQGFGWVKRNAWSHSSLGHSAWRDYFWASPPNWKRNQFKLPRQKLHCKQAAKATEFPTCHSKADVETEGHACPTAASASLELRDTLCQNPCATLGFEFVQWGWADEKGTPFKWWAALAPQECYSWLFLLVTHYLQFSLNHQLNESCYLQRTSLFHWKMPFFWP